jgi:hypothetical protein
VEAAAQAAAATKNFFFYFLRAWRAGLFSFSSL